MSSLFLGAAFDGRQAEAVLVDEPGAVLARGRGASLEEALAPCRAALDGREASSFLAAEPTAARGCCRVAALAEPVDEPAYAEAVAAGALGGVPGLVVAGEGRTRVLVLDRTGRLHSVPADRRRSAEAGADELVARALAVHDGRRLERAMERMDPLQAVLHEADYPGPDPHLRGLVVATVRRLVALVREGRHRIPGTGRVEGTWAGPLMEPPLRTLFEQEVFRHAPEIRWRPPRLRPALGAALLARVAAGLPARERMRALLRQEPALRSWIARLEED